MPTVDHDWGYTADAVLDRGIAVPRARIMVGCSATNACFAWSTPFSEARRIARSEPMVAIVTGPEPAPGPAAPPGDHRALATWARTAVSTFHHPVGTCAMGPDPALGAVTDHRGSVHGVGGLTVADASIMPSIPAATTNLPTIMVAEHLAPWL